MASALSCTLLNSPFLIFTPLWQQWDKKDKWTKEKVTKDKREKVKYGLNMRTEKTRKWTKEKVTKDKREKVKIGHNRRTEKTKNNIK